MTNPDDEDLAEQAVEVAERSNRAVERFNADLEVQAEMDRRRQEQQ